MTGPALSHYQHSAASAACLVRARPGTELVFSFTQIKLQLNTTNKHQHFLLLRFHGWVVFLDRNTTTVSDAGGQSPRLAEILLPTTVQEVRFLYGKLNSPHFSFHCAPAALYSLLRLPCTFVIHTSFDKIKVALNKW